MESKVYRNLEGKLKIIGLDFIDLMITLFVSGVMNLIFGRSFLGFWTVVVFPICLLGILHFGKRNKPERFLEHFIKWLILPAFLKAGRGSKKRQRRIYEESF